MARVYRGFDKKLNPYAGQSHRRAFDCPTDQDEYRQRFQNEARAIARLNHPNIVSYLQFDQVGTIYHGDEFHRSRDLRSHLRDVPQNTMPYPEVCG
jgi:serine/threonine-protein kinase